MTQEKLSLYLDLEPGEHADLEIAARAALAFVDYLREIAFVIDPSLELRIELESGSEGSLSLNAILKRLGKLNISPETAKAIIIASAIWLGEKGLEFTYNKIADHVFEKIAGESEKRFSETEIQAIADRVAKALSGKTAEKQVQRLFREVERDKAVRGVGIATEPLTRPVYIVPRSEFAVRGGQVKKGAEEKSRRVKTETRRVVLISPVLLAGTRRWRFLTSDIGEFGAPVKDEVFVDHVLAGDLTTLFRSNVELTVELETVEEFQDSVWIPVERNILRVIGIPRPDTLIQQSFQFPGEQADGPERN